MRKSSIKLSAQTFRSDATSIVLFADHGKAALSAQEASWAYDAAIIRLYRSFENLMLDALVGAINNDTAHLATKASISLPKHLSRDVCEYLVVGSGYFDFKGRDGLIKLLKKFVPDTHYLVVTVKKATYRDALERMSALRNYAAHGSSQAKQAALTATGQQRIGSAGSWLKGHQRLKDIADKLSALASELEAAAPF